MAGRAPVPAPVAAAAAAAAAPARCAPVDVRECGRGCVRACACWCRLRRDLTRRDAPRARHPSTVMIPQPLESFFVLIPHSAQPPRALPPPRLHPPPGRAHAPTACRARERAMRAAEAAAPSRRDRRLAAAGNDAERAALEAPRPPARPPASPLRTNASCAQRARRGGRKAGGPSRRATPEEGRCPTPRGGRAAADQGPARPSPPQLLYAFSPRASLRGKAPPLRTKSAHSWTCARPPGGEAGAQARGGGAARGAPRALSAGRHAARGRPPHALPAPAVRIGPRARSAPCPWSKWHLPCATTAPGAVLAPRSAPLWRKSVVRGAWWVVLRR